MVAIRPATTPETLDQSNEFQEMCWRNGIATYPTIARAGVALANLLEWQRRQR